MSRAPRSALVGQRLEAVGGGVEHREAAAASDLHDRERALDLAVRQEAEGAVHAREPARLGQRPDREIGFAGMGGFLELDDVGLRATAEGRLRLDALLGRLL